jgi:uncharacterized protein DUF4386
MYKDGGNGGLVTSRANARIAGFTYIFYTAVALIGMTVLGRATSGDSVAAKFTSMAQSSTNTRVAVVLSLLGCFSALVLAVTLYAITREQDQDLAILALTFRVAEGVLSAVSISALLGLLWLAAGSGPNAPDAATAQGLGSLLFRLRVLSAPITASFFSIGSAIFCWLFLRGRIIPVALASLGVILSVILVIALPLQIMEILGAAVIRAILFSMLAFEVPLGCWLLIKGVRVPAR